MATDQTNQERRTAAAEIKAKKTLQKHYPKYFSDEYNAPELNYVAGSSPHEIWRYDISKKRGGEDENESIYLVRDGSEFMSYDDAEEAFCDVIISQRERKISQRWRYFASPLIISGAIAIGLLMLISFLQIKFGHVPDQLWAIFTAVVAFYFGKEGWSSMRNASAPEGD